MATTLSQVGAKPAPVLQEERPARRRMFLDLGWLLGAVFRLMPFACSLWAASALLLGLLVPAQLWLTKALIDALAAHVRGGAADGSFLWLGLLVATLLLERAVGGLQPWLAAMVREATGTALQERVMRAATAFDLASFEHQGYYDQLNRVMADVETRVPRLQQQVMETFQAAPQFLGYGVALLVLTPVLPLVVLGAVIPTIVGFAVMGQSNWQLLNAQTRDRRLAGYYAALLTGRAFAKEVRLYGLAGYLRDHWSTLFRRTRAAQRRLALRQGLRQRGMILAMASVSMLGLWWVVAGGLIHTTAGGYALLFQSLEGMIGTSFVLSGAVSAFGEHSGYASAFRAFTRAAPGGEGDGGAGSRGAGDAGSRPLTGARLRKGRASQAGPQGGREARAPAGDRAPRNQALPATDARFWPPASRSPGPARGASITFEDVWFTYPGGARPALAGVSFRLAAGETVALVGENGAGKTTIAKLLLGLYRPDRGRVTLDGVDLRAVPPGALRATMSAVFQQFVRYQLTVAENVALGDPRRGGDRRAVIRATEQAGAADVVARLPEGYATLLGPDVGGVDLSGGQWQRLALARAFFRNAAVLVLDEPTAALDPLAELALFERFAELAAGRTALLISHRLGMARLADRVLVLAGGKLIESGAHAQLLQAGGEYAALFEGQARWYR